VGLLATGCSRRIEFVSAEYDARPAQPLNPKAALTEVNALRARNGLNPLVLDERLSRAAAMQSTYQASRTSIGHYGPDGSKPRDRALRAGYRPRIAAENVAAGHKSFSDVMRSWERSSGHRRNLLRPNVTSAGFAMVQSKSGRAYWTLVLARE
jgi:uncharacterized protein YkwD